jgi:acyl carrier protein phosphodiesterase
LPQNCRILCIYIGAKLTSGLQLNYVAHIHIGAHTQTSLLGNFLGDFVKGSQLSHLPYELEQGIRLHRSVDSFTDSHPLIVESRKLFSKDLRRVSGIIIDVYYDFLLMKNWQRFSKQPHTIIFEQFYQQLEGFELPQNHHFCQLSHRLKTYRWLSKYTDPETCHQAFLSIEKRLNNKIVFADKAQTFIQKNTQILESRFNQFYPECLVHAEQFIQSYPSAR